jgi:hypothetical protein
VLCYGWCGNVEIIYDLKYHHGTIGMCYCWSCRTLLCDGDSCSHRKKNKNGCRDKDSRRGGAAGPPLPLSVPRWGWLVGIYSKLRLIT